MSQHKIQQGQLQQTDRDSAFAYSSNGLSIRSEVINIFGFGQLAKLRMVGRLATCVETMGTDNFYSSLSLAAVDSRSDSFFYVALVEGPSNVILKAQFWNRNCYYYRQDAAKRQTAGIVFTHRPKIRFFAPQGRHVAPIQVKLCSTDGHLGPLSWAKFHVNRCRRVGMRPQNIKNFHFLVKSRLAGATPLTDFQNV